MQIGFNRIHMKNSKTKKATAESFGGLFMKFVKFCCCDYSAVMAEPSCSPLIVISLMAEFQASEDSAS